MCTGVKRYCRPQRIPLKVDPSIRRAVVPLDACFQSVACTFWGPAFETYTQNTAR